MSHDDPFDAADDPEVGTPEFWGQAQVDAYYCILEKGRGKVPFDAAQHGLDQRRTAIKFGILPLPEQNVTRDVYRDYVAEFGAWPKITLPSLKAAGLSTRTLNGAWVRVALVPEGRTYTSKTGETKESLTFLVMEVYPDEGACRAAYLAHKAAKPADDVPFDAPTTTPAATPTNGSDGNGADKARETAQKFMEAIVKQEAGDPARVAEKLAKMPLVNRYFAIDSPEVISACAAAMK